MAEDAELIECDYDLDDMNVTWTDKPMTEVVFSMVVGAQGDCGKEDGPRQRCVTEMIQSSKRLAT